MRRGWPWAWLALGFVLEACGQCRSKSDCDQGERCDFDRGSCVPGCTGNADCAATSRCNLELGRCEPGTRLPFFTDEDAAVEDVTTSTAPDAQVGD